MVDAILRMSLSLWISWSLLLDIGHHIFCDAVTSVFLDLGNVSSTIMVHRYMAILLFPDTLFQEVCRPLLPNGILNGGVSQGQIVAIARIIPLFRTSLHKSG